MDYPHYDQNDDRSRPFKTQSAPLLPLFSIKYRRSSDRPGDVRGPLNRRSSNEFRRSSDWLGNGEGWSAGQIIMTGALVVLLSVFALMVVLSIVV